MRGALRLLWVCALMSGLFSLVGWPASVLADELLVVSGSSSLSSHPLVIGGWPEEARELQADGEAKRANPEAGAVRVEDETKFENLDGEQAERVDGEAFSQEIDRPAGGPPQLPASQRISGFVNDNTAQVELGEGQNGLIESSVPMATLSSPGRWLPVDLGLSEAGGAFSIANPLVSVGISKRLADGVQLPESGLSVVAVDGSNTPLDGSGVIDGSVVLYANTQTDTDTVIKPTALGFDAAAILRSVNSPTQFDYRLGLPQGASLEQEERSGLVRIAKEGATVAQVLPPVARDTAGTIVPVTMSVSGDKLVLTIDHSAGSYLYPIEMDPEFNTKTDTTVSMKLWPFTSEGEFTDCECSEHKLLITSHKYTAGQWGSVNYQTKGDSKVYEINTVTTFEPTAGSGSEYYLTEGEDYIEFTGEHGSEHHVTIAKEGMALTESPLKSRACVSEPACSPENGTGNNTVHLVEKASGTGSVYFQLRMESATVSISQPKETHSTVSYSSSPEIEYLSGEKHEKATNIFYGAGAWFGPHSGVFEFTSKDIGLGVSATAFEVLKGSTWETLLSKNYLVEGSACVSIQCASEQHETVTWAMVGSRLPNGRDTVRASAHDPMSGTSSSEHGEGEATINVDSTAPHGLELVGLPFGGELNEQTYTLSAQATDGSGSTASSGVKSIALAFDGLEVTGGNTGSCTPGPCTASGEWKLNGENVGAGKDTVTIIATDYAGNIETKSYEIMVRHSTPLHMGPGSVNSLSGNLSLSASDVNMSGGEGTLSVTRSYSSRNPKAGAKGPLGPQWSISLGSMASLEVLPDNGVMVIGPEGLTHFTVKSGGGFEAPLGDSSLTLEAKEHESKITEYLLRNSTKGTTTKFTLPSGAESWMPTISEGPVSTDTTTDTYKTAEVAGQKIVEPALELAPHPAASCTSVQLEKREITAKGCRALEFIYAEKTTATGEGPSEWKEYKGRLSEIVFIAYNPSTKTIQGVPVAQYAYDTQGRLRAEWDPRVSPALRTTYGYDDEEHLTALSEPGQQPWLFRYGTIASDPNTGRLLSVTRPAAATEFGSGSLPSNTSGPSLSGEGAKIGTTLSVSNGAWSNAPLLYSYQWEDCSTETCIPILDAVNQTYTPLPSDAGYELLARVTATNAAGSSESAVSSAREVTLTVPKYLRKFGEAGEAAGQFKGPSSVAIDASGDVWVTDNPNSRVEEFSTTGSFIKTVGWGVSNGKTEFQTCTASCRAGIAGSGNGQFSKPEGIAINLSTGNMYVADKGNNRVQELSSTGSFVKVFGESGSGPGQMSAPLGLGIDPMGNVWVTDSANNRVDEFTSEGVWMSSFGEAGERLGQFKAPDGIAFSGAYAYIADTGNNRVQKCTMSSSCVSQFGSSGSGNKQFSSPKGVASDPVSGDLYVVDSGNSRVQILNPAGWFVTRFGTKGSSNGEYSGPEGIALNSTGDVYVADTTNDRVQELEPTYSTSNPAPEPPSVGSSAVSTIDYRVPVSGSGAPYPMSKSEVETWGQKDIPVEATAIFPPTKPMGWPAKEYTGETVYYFDSKGRMVNVAASSGGISTTEYNTYNNVTRTLSADNRTTALKEAKPIEAAEKLSTISTYNESGSEPGTQLLETLGPQHEVKRSKGAETLARNHIKYIYNQGAKEVEEKTHETYSLVTETIDTGETPGKEVFDERTTTTSYSGQNNLGWKLREPTSVTTEPSGLKLTTTTIYNEETGVVVETRSPSDTSGESNAPSHSVEFGSSGTGAGQFSNPIAMAVDAGGNLWIVDYGNNRLEKFSSSGTFLDAFGFGVVNGEEKYQICTSACHAGNAGSGSGQFKEPRGITINQSTGNIYVTDSGNGRIEELSSSGSFVRAFGSPGSGNGNLSTPNGLSVDSAGNVWVTDTGNQRIEEFGAEGKYEGKYGSEGTGADQFKTPNDVAVSDGNVFIADYANNRIDELSPTGTFIQAFGYGVADGSSKPEVCTTTCQAGIAGSANGQLSGPARLASDPNSTDLYVGDHSNSRVEEFNPDGAFLATFGSVGKGEWQFENLKSVSIASTGGLYVSDNGNNRVQKYVPPTSKGYTGATNIQTIYYTATPNAMAATCGEHIEWVGLPCQTQPLTQPENSKPDLPVTTVTYNIWDAVETTTEKMGTATRTKKTTFDIAGRGITSEVTASTGTTVPKVTDKYSTETGALVEQSTTVAEKTVALKAAFNSLGQVTSYTDASGITSTFEYEHEHAGRLKKVNDGKGTQTYEYNTTTGQLSELVDSVAGTFTASYDVGGHLASETYPNGMTATYTRNPAGQTTSLEYKKMTHCSEKCVWFSDTNVPSIHGETLAQTSTLATENYTYDPIGRLTETEETPIGKACAKREYTYEQESNRTGQTTGECHVEGGELTSHIYDTANRLIDPNTAYDPIGDTTSLEAQDAGGSELQSTYYTDGQLATQTQSGQTLEYKTDPEGRTLETISSIKSTVTTNYSSSGAATSWISEEEGKKWTRNIPGIDGTLTATQTNTGTVTVQLHDLQGNVVGTVPDIETETKLLTTYNSTEFGVPVNGTPPTKYSWLGADGISSEQPTTGTMTQNGATYVPQLGRGLQTISPTIPTPSNSTIPYTIVLAPWVIEGTAAAAKELTNREQAKRAEEEANRPSGTIPSGNPGWWCGGEYGPCEEEAIGGSGDEEGGGASIASRPQCEVKWKMAEIPSNNGVLYLAGGFLCKHHVEHFELQLCLFVEYPGSGKYSQLYCAGENGLDIVLSDTNGEEILIKHSCAAGLIYTGWIWGREFSKTNSYVYTNSSIYSSKHESMVCSGRSVDGYVTEFEALH
jgi:DNA-binding beta-propeller fold protein YncE